MIRSITRMFFILLLLFLVACNQASAFSSTTETPPVTEALTKTESPSVSLRAEPTHFQSKKNTLIESESSEVDSDMTSITITIGDTSYVAKLYNNETATAFLSSLPMTLDMSELNRNEKYYYLPDRLPTNAQQVGQIQAGDLMLYGADCLVLFYKNFSTSYHYTKLGFVEDADGLAAALGNKSVQVTFALCE